MMKQLCPQSTRWVWLCLWRLFLVFAFVGLPAAVPATPALAAPQVQVKLNHPLGANLPVLDFRLSPDGSRVVYRAARTLPPDQVNPPPPTADLFSVPAAGGTAVQLNTPAVAAAETIESYQFSPDGSRVIYLRTTTDAALGNVFELSSAPADGSSAPVSISGPIAIGARATGDFDFSFAPAPDGFVMGDGSVRMVNFNLRNRDVPERIASITDGTSNTFFFGEQANNLLQGEMTDGSVRQLNPPLVAGGVVYDFLATPDGTRTIYRADQNLDGAIELFSIPADGSDAGFRISGPLVAGGDVLDFKVNALSTRAVYRADQTTNGVAELYSARTNGGIVAKLNAPLPLGGAVTQFAFSPDGLLVVYLADQIANEKYDLYAVASSGGPATLLSSGASGASVRSFVISPDGGQVYYVDNSGPSGALRLNSRPLALGAAPGQALPGPHVAGLAAPDVQLSTDGSRLVYLADSTGDGVFELASISLAPTPAVAPQINPPLAAGGNIRAFKISPDGSEVVYAADQNVAGVVELFKVPSGGGAAERLSGNLTPGGSVRSGRSDFAFSPDGRAVYYLADQETDNLTELFVAYDAPVLEWTEAGYVAAEDGSLAPQLGVRRSGNALAPASVRVQLTGAPDGGTATGGASLGAPGVDFVDNVRDLLFAAGEITKTFAVPIQNDGVPEPAETFSLQLFEPVQAVTGTLDSAQVVILDTANSPLLADAALSVAENSADGTQVAGALPAAPGVTYAILSGNTGGAFRIDSSGALLVQNSAALNFEATPVFTLLVEARAGNGSSDIATWTVALQDQNEAPQFLAQVRSVAEGSANGTAVGARLAASDPDRNPITFTLTSTLFDVSAGGQLRVKNGALLDFETQKQHQVQVTVTDSAGLSRAATITVNLVDVAETDPSAITIVAVSPASAVAGGKEFKLTLKGSNFTTNSVVRWNGSIRKTALSSGALIALIEAADIANATTAKIDVVDSTLKQQSASVPFAVKTAAVGVAELAVETGTFGRSVVGETTVFNLRWTHTSQPWRTMNEMELRLVDDDKIVLWVRYQETRDESDNDISTLILLNADGTPAGQGRFGAAQVLENDTVRLDLAQASFEGSGPTGASVRVRIPVSFKAAAVQDEAYTIQMVGVDDLGGEQGPNLMGSWRIAQPALYLPVVQR